MWRFLAGAGSALVLMGVGFLWGQSQSRRAAPAAPLNFAAAASQLPDAAPEEGSVPTPSAPKKSREEKRFGRYDKNKDGIISRDEYLLSRQKAFAKLDRNGDGRLDLSEYATKTLDKFAKADRDASGTLNAAEFATTAVKRKTAVRAAPCPPAQAVNDQEPDNKSG